MLKYTNPKVFISYAWKDTTKMWVRELAVRLRSDGIDAFLDDWALSPGELLPEFMENSVSESDFVLIVCTPKYKEKSDSHKASGVKYEKGIITGELFSRHNHKKFIPVLQDSTWGNSAPSWALGKLFIDLRGDTYKESDYQYLVKTLYGKKEIAPPLGAVPDFVLENEGVSQKAANEKALIIAAEEARKAKLTENPAGIEWIRIPAGEFMMGSNDYDNEKAPRKVYLGEYWIAKTPVTNAQFKKFIEAGGYKNRMFWSENGWEWRSGEKRTQPTYWDNKKWNMLKQPVVGVNWYEAEAFSKWANCRLPSEAEWEKAARGTDGRKYPWGSQEPNKNLANFDLANFDLSIGKTTPVGKYSPAGDSPYGCVDMAGNVQEWCADWYGKNYYANSPKSNPLGLINGDFKVWRGGSWCFDDSYLRVTDRGYDDPDDAYDSIGFRCSRSLP